MPKKIAIVGRGTVGCMAAAHFLRQTDYEIDWIYDPNIIPAAVGEGTSLALPRALIQNLSFDGNDMKALGGTLKLGIGKQNWGKSGKGNFFLHPFPLGTNGIHFNAVLFQDYIFNKIKDNSRLNLVQKNIINEQDIDASHIMMCTGSPSVIEGEYRQIEHIPVNSCVVSQCLWEYPRFDHTLTYAMPWGWVFGIPLQNRCAIGYLYNDKFTTEENIKIEVQEVLKELNLKQNTQRTIKFNNYSRKNNFSNRVSYNGNASFFLEPLEATSTGFAHLINIIAKDVFELKTTPQYANDVYNDKIDSIESMICLHYFAGSSFKNEFWDYAESLGVRKIEHKMSSSNVFSNMIKKALASNNIFDVNGDVGTWSLKSYKINIEKLGIKDRLQQYI